MNDLADSALQQPGRHGDAALAGSTVLLRSLQQRRRCALLVPGGLPVTARVEGDALAVLHTVVTDWECS